MNEGQVVLLYPRLSRGPSKAFQLLAIAICNSSYETANSSSTSTETVIVRSSHIAWSPPPIPVILHESTGQAVCSIRKAQGTKNKKRQCAGTPQCTLEEKNTQLGRDQDTAWSVSYTLFCVPSVEMTDNRRSLWNIENACLLQLPSCGLWRILVPVGTHISTSAHLSA